MTFNVNFFSPSELDNLQNEVQTKLQEAQQNLKKMNESGATPDLILRMQEGITRFQNSLNTIEQARTSQRTPSCS